MKRKLILCLCLCLLMAPALVVAVEEQGTEAKELSGMSIVGNDEAPKSLYIVPWKSSEIGVETSMDMLVDQDNVPIDRDVFKRQLDFYEVSKANNSGRIK